MTSIRQQSIAALSQDVSISLKGIFAIMVLLHHFQQRTGIIMQPLIGKAFELLGFLSVSVFLFFSGYGLMTSLEKKGKRYLDDFLKNRIYPLYCINLLLILLSALKEIITGGSILLKDILSSLFLAHTIVTYGWYIQTILIFYILFYGVFTIIKNKTAGFIFLASFVVVYVIISHTMDAEPATYISSLAFILGMICSRWKGKAIRFFENKLIATMLSITVFLAFIVLSLLYTNRHVRYISRIIAAPFFVLIILVITEVVCNFNMKIIVNKVTKKLGEISLEIYVVQGFFFDIFRNNCIYVANDTMYILFVGICTLMASFLLHPLFSLIYLSFKNSHKYH